jgi:antitoxin MazE
MRTRIQKWGNSLALRIPKSFASEAGIEKESAVDLSITDGKLIITPALQDSYDLEALLARITPENTHSEVNTAKIIGNESW